MSASSMSPSLARLGLRLLAVFFIVEGFWRLLSNLFASLHEIDPNYLGFYFRSQALSPLLGIVLGLLLYLVSDWLGRRLLGGKADQQGAEKG